MKPRTLLVLGSKPDPVLPEPQSYDAVACANGSGFSAAKHGLPSPAFTVMSAILGSVDSGKQSVAALQGLRTERLYFSPRPEKSRGGVRQLIRTIKTYDMQPFYLKRMLRRASYSYGDFVVRPHDDYLRMVRNLCLGDADVLAQVERKQPSTGVMTLVIGAAEEGFDRFVLSGFSFELTHAYGTNPEIAERGTQASGHANTDVAVLRHLSATLGSVYTTEPIVEEKTGVPLLPE
ncbi:MAG: hypothetical protein P8R42_16770 [Candidatus Binatia bacterium]|nr:hypothetical protein [Candidatus Binatia bacterium]